MVWINSTTSTNPRFVRWLQSHGGWVGKLLRLYQDHIIYNSNTNTVTRLLNYKKILHCPWTASMTSFLFLLASFPFLFFLTYSSAIMFAHDNLLSDFIIKHDQLDVVYLSYCLSHTIIQLGINLLSKSCSYCISGWFWIKADFSPVCHSLDDFFQSIHLLFGTASTQEVHPSAPWIE